LSQNVEADTEINKIHSSKKTFQEFWRKKFFSGFWIYSLICGAMSSQQLKNVFFRFFGGKKIGAKLFFVPLESF
jgi:hypothetical protein